jgi:hypothetical protein
VSDGPAACVRSLIAATVSEIRLLGMRVAVISGQGATDHTQRHDSAPYSVSS